MANKFKLVSTFKPAGDQPKAIESLVDGLKKGLEHQTLLGVTGSGKTFSVANVIAAVQKPTLVIAHNKTLAAQLAQEYRDFFPENAVHYFVSYYDYYQPEAYVAATDTYIEKEAQINEEIDRLRHATTQSLLTRKDVIVVASVSCIYGLGSPEEYEKENIKLQVGQKLNRSELLHKLVGNFFTRTNADLSRGTFRAIGGNVEIMPANEYVIYAVQIGSRGIETLKKIDPVSRKILGDEKAVFLFPAKHFITDKDKLERAIAAIKMELEERLKYFKKAGKLLEADRLKRRTNYDLAMLGEVGYCSGIENYSRHLSGRSAGSPSETLLSYFPHGPRSDLKGAQGRTFGDFLTIIDESHVTVPQLSGMYAGDESRKRVLIEHGFRLPSALDNRPLKFNEFAERVGQIIYTSATPGPYELEKTKGSPLSDQGLPFGQVVQQIIRPTGLIDPEVEVRPVRDQGPTLGSLKVGPLSYPGQIADVIEEIKKVTAKGDRSIVTTLTKKMAEDLSEFLKEQGIKAEYLHSEIKTLERIKILTDFRRGKFDCLVGVNLLREGLDLPEVSFIGILDADKEGFLRSETSLIQIIGRAARNVSGRVVLYADRITGSIKRAVDETNRRRRIQFDYNKRHKITPRTISKKVKDITEELKSEHRRALDQLVAIDKIGSVDLEKLIKQKEHEMGEAARILDFETAALLRDEIKVLKNS